LKEEMARKEKYTGEGRMRKKNEGKKSQITAFIAVERRKTPSLKKADAKRKSGSKGQKKLPAEATHRAGKGAWGVGA